MPCAWLRAPPLRPRINRLLFREGELTALAPQAIEHPARAAGTSRPGDRRVQADETDLAGLCGGGSPARSFQTLRCCAKPWVTTARHTCRNSSEARLPLRHRERGHCPGCSPADHPAAARRRNVGAALRLALLRTDLLAVLPALQGAVRSLGGTANLAVVPIESLSIDLEQGAFPPGLPEALTSELSRLRSGQIISPSTVERFGSSGSRRPSWPACLRLHVVIEGTAQSFRPTGQGLPALDGRPFRQTDLG